MDRVEEEVQKVLHREHPEIGEVFVVTDVMYRGMYIFTEPKMWLFRPGERWVTGLYRTVDRKDFRGLSRRIKTYFRQAKVHAEVRKWVIDHLSWLKQSAAQSKKRTGVSFSGHRRS